MRTLFDQYLLEESLVKPKEQAICLVNCTQVQKFPTYDVENSDPWPNEDLVYLSVKREKVSVV